MMLDQRIELHKSYWNRENMKRPIASFKLGDFFFSCRFRAAHKLLEKGKKIEPHMIDVDSFLEDYERIYGEINSIGQDGFWVAEPFTGIPWMEGILGCDIIGNENSFISHPWAKSIDDFDKISFDTNNLWFEKYMEFLEKLKKLSNGRFPLGQPILRGPSDMVGAVIGQNELVYALIEEPEKMEEVFEKVTDIFLDVIKHQYGVIPDFNGGYSFGFYHLWTPGKCIWYQEDLSALLSPRYYRDFLKEANMKICRDYEYTGMHLHPVSFFILDDLMEIERLKVIQINKDVGGPSVKQMLPAMQKILGGKNLILWGDLTKEDIDLVCSELPHKGVFLNIVTPTLDSAKELMEHLSSKSM